MPDMKATRIHAYGGPEVLIYENAPMPVAGRGEVLVRIHAAGVNPVDWKIRAGYLKDFMPISFPAILGMDLSGVVEAVGEGVTSFKAGDEVYAMANMKKGGTYAEYIAIEEGILAAKPRTLNHIHAAAMPLAGLTAYHGLFEFGNLQAGQKVLIHGAAGGVGSFAVQLAKWKGAHVIGTASGRNQSFLRELGVEHAIDYGKQAFEKSISEMDLVIDTIGGETQERSWSVLKKGGILASTVGQPKASANAPKETVGKAIQNRPNADALKFLANLADTGKLMAFIESELPLKETRKAHEMIQTGHTRGKIVLRTA